MSFFVCLSIVPHAQASKFKGHDKIRGSEQMNFNEPVERFIETKKEFLILFVHHPAFYFFPKNKSSAREFRDFLNTRMSSQKKLLVTFDPKTVKITSIEDSK